MRASSVSTKSVSGQRFSLGSILRAGAAAIVAAVIANIIVLFVVRAIFDLPADFLPLQVGPIVIFTTLGVAAGVAVFALINRVARRPILTFRLVAVIALVLSLIPNVLYMFNPAAAPQPGGTALAFGVLMIFHVVAAAVSVSVLTGLVRR